jgi:hypothetical protein
MNCRFLYLYIFVVLGVIPVLQASSIHSKKCGDFLIVDDSESFETTICQESAQFDASDENYKTKTSKLVVLPSKELWELTHDSQKILDQLLYEKIKKLVKLRFSETFAFARTSNNKDLLKALQDAERELFKEKKNNPRKEVQKFLSIFPDLERSLVLEDPNFKPLLCQYEVHKHREKNLRKFSRVLGLIATVGGASGIIAAGMLSIPMIPAAFYAMSVLKISSGSLKIRNSLATWTDVHSEKVAKKMLDVFNESEEEKNDLEHENKKLKKLKSTPELSLTIQNNNERIRQIEMHLKESKPIIMDLKKAVGQGKRIKRELISGILDTALASVAFVGGNFSGKQLKDFHPNKDQIKTIQPDPKVDGSYTPLGPEDLQGPGTTYVDP